MQPNKKDATNGLFYLLRIYVMDELQQELKSALSGLDNGSKKKKPLILMAVALTFLVFSTIYVTYFLYFKQETNFILPPTPELTDMRIEDKSNPSARSFKTGREFQKHVEFAASNAGFKVMNNKDYHENYSSSSNGRYAVKNEPFNSIYNENNESDFLLVDHEKRFSIRVEVMWMQTKGSVRQRLPYHFLNAVQNYPEKYAVFILDGPGWSAGSIDWMKRAASGKIEWTTHLKSNRHKKDILVMNLSEFLNWIILL